MDKKQVAHGTMIAHLSPIVQEGQIRCCCFQKTKAGNAPINVFPQGGGAGLPHGIRQF